jgi:signal transduction histidine kinase
MAQVVKDAIVEVRYLALNLRPSTLDQLGLLATISWFCRELSRLNPGWETSYELGVVETDVPQPLKIIVYRVLEETSRA